MTGDVSSATLRNFHLRPLTLQTSRLRLGMILAFLGNPSVLAELVAMTELVRSALCIKTVARARQNTDHRNTNLAKAWSREKVRRARFRFICYHSREDDYFDTVCPVHVNFIGVFELGMTPAICSSLHIYIRSTLSLSLSLRPSFRPSFLRHTEDAPLVSLISIEQFEATVNPCFATQRPSVQPSD